MALAFEIFRTDLTGLELKLKLKLKKMHYVKKKVKVKVHWKLRILHASNLCTEEKSAAPMGDEFGSGYWSFRSAEPASLGVAKTFISQIISLIVNRRFVFTFDYKLHI